MNNKIFVKGISIALLAIPNILLTDLAQAAAYTKAKKAKPSFQISGALNGA